MKPSSEELYTLMCTDIVGSEKIVNYRRLFFKIQDDVFNSHPFSENRIQISCGSKAEGLFMTGSDLDVVRTLVKFIAYTRWTTEENIDTTKAVVYMDSESASPGYSFLWIHDKDHPEWKESFMKRTHDGFLFSSSRFKEWMKAEQWSTILGRYNSCMCTRGAHDISGPCISSTQLDQAFGVVCKSWPEAAMPWVSRKRPYQYPTEQIITSQTERGILLVPVGNKTDSVQVHPEEWRISFARSEKDLIHSWNHTQMVCYACLKIILREFIKPKPENYILTSYLIKTSLLWISEEIEPVVWSPENLYMCFVQCIKRLSYYFKFRFFPNYFISECNMIKSTTTEQSLINLYKLLDDISVNGHVYLLQCPSLSGSLKLKLDAGIPDRLTPFDYALLPLLSSYLPEPPEPNLSVLYKCIQNIMYSTSPRTKTTYLMLLVQCAYENARSTIFNNLTLKNKYSYMNQRCLQCITFLSTNADAVSGWICLALVFYINKRYKDTLSILKFLHLKCTRNKIMIWWRTYLRMADLRSHEQNKVMFSGNFFCKLRQCIMKSFVQIQSPVKSVSAYLDDRMRCLFTAPPQQYITCPPETLIHYLRFLCFAGIKDTRGCQKSVIDLKDTVENNGTVKDPYFPYISYQYLTRVYMLTNDTKSAQRYRAKVEKFEQIVNRNLSIA